MSFFVSAVGSMQLVNYMGIAVTVPVSWLKNGYISTDKDGTVWVYAGMSTRNSDHWGCMSEESSYMTTGQCVHRIGVYLDIHNKSSSVHDFIAEHVWKNSLVKISDCPLIIY